VGLRKPKKNPGFSRNGLAKASIQFYLYPRAKARGNSAKARGNSTGEYFLIITIN
jgi:hypothetical protein